MSAAPTDYRNDQAPLHPDDEEALAACTRDLDAAMQALDDWTRRNAAILERDRLIHEWADAVEAQDSDLFDERVAMAAAMGCFAEIFVNRPPGEDPQRDEELLAAPALEVLRRLVTARTMGATLKATAPLLVAADEANKREAIAAVAELRELRRVSSEALHDQGSTLALAPTLRVRWAEIEAGRGDPGCPDLTWFSAARSGARGDTYPPFTSLDATTISAVCARRFGASPCR